MRYTFAVSCIYFCVNLHSLLLRCNCVLIDIYGIKCVYTKIKFLYILLKRNIIVLKLNNQCIFTVVISSQNQILTRNFSQLMLFT